MRHEPLLAVTILGVLRSGRPYVALDARFPVAQLGEIVQDTGAGFLLTDNTHHALAAQLRRAGSTPAAINIEELEEELQLEAGVEIPIFTDNDLRKPAALFYTSGSTGKPKGVLQNHLCIAHTARNYADALQLTNADTVLYAVHAAVGASSSLIFGTLCSGATLYFFDLQNGNFAALRRQMQSERISVLHCVPSVFRAIFENLESEGLPFLRAVKLGGEAVTQRDLRLFQDARAQKKVRADCRFLNGLGITEAGGNVCFFDATHLNPQTTAVPVGFAAPGYELELAQNGELIIGGDFLADGYWNLPAETAAVFQTRPDGKRFYRSGDAARLDANGALEYSGRLNHRVKIRGRQVDLLAVETALQTVENIGRAAVVFHEATKNSGAEETAPVLIGCYQTRNRREIPAADLRVAAGNVLPEFMVPATFLHIEEWPLLASGKTNRQTLKSLAVAAWERERESAGENYENSDAYDPLEAQLQRIWQKALRVKRVQTTDDFFALGGHSLAAAEISTEVHRRFAIEIPLTALAEHSTIRRLALALRRQKIDNRSRFLAFNSSGSRAPLFFAPGAGSDAFSLVELARSLGAAQPFIALHPPGFDGTSPFPESITAFAEYYLPTIREIAPRGPYFLGGSSFGGVVMFEVARLLQAQNEDVALLALVDAKAAGYPVPRRVLGCTTPLYALWQLLPLHNKFSFAPRNIARGLREKSALRQARRELASNRPRPFERRFMHLRYASFAAKKNYRPAPYAGDVHLFPSQVQPLASVFETDENLGWTPYVSGRLIRRVLPGKHNDYMREPIVATLAQFLGEALENTKTAPAHPTHRRGSTPK
jgi:acyl-coenzyme A synthetase/AMP-(fatty) acid ligase/thioesterase domain-containing protein/acyl carrier protein